MTKELWTVIVDAIVSAATLVIGFWLEPEYRDISLAFLAIAQSVAMALIVHFAAERKIKSLQAEIKAVRSLRH